MSRRDWIPLTDCTPTATWCGRHRLTTTSGDLANLALTPKLFIQRCMFAVQIIVLHGNQRFSQIVSFDDAQGKSKSCSLFTSSPFYVIDCLRLVRHPSFINIIKSTISHFPCSPDELVGSLFQRHISKGITRVTISECAFLSRYQDYSSYSVMSLSAGSSLRSASRSESSSLSLSALESRVVVSV